MKAFLPSLVGHTIVRASLALIITLTIAGASAHAQCPRRGGGGPPGGPPPQRSGNPESAYGPGGPGQSNYGPAEAGASRVNPMTRVEQKRALQARYQVKQEQLQEKKASIRATNQSRQRSKSTKPDSPVANQSNRKAENTVS